MTPFEKRKQLASACMELATVELPVLASLTGIERQFMESFIQATMHQYESFLNTCTCTDEKLHEYCPIHGEH